jgi:hypothetical protein
MLAQFSLAAGTTPLPLPLPPMREVTNRVEFAHIRSLDTNFVSTQNPVRCGSLSFPRTSLKIVTNKRKLFNDKQSLDSFINNKAWAILFHYS